MFVVVTLVRSSESQRTVGDVAADVCDGETFCGRKVFNVGSVLFEDVQG